MAKGKTADVEIVDRLYLRPGVTVPPWSLEDSGGVGVEGYYARKPLGSRCIWTATYLHPGGVWRAADFLPVERLTVRQARYELADHLGPKANIEAARLLWRLVEDEGALPDVVKWLDANREYRETVAWWTPRPENAVYPIYRAGWAPVGHRGATV